MKNLFTFLFSCFVWCCYAQAQTNIEPIDLGLPSGTKWANMNLGATKPSDVGNYFAWGETAPKSNYDWSTYKFGAESNFTKYNSTDGLTQLELEDDAAYVILGKDWRMPTHKQEVELVNECSWEITIVNGVYGYKVTGPNGNSIFMPRGGLYDGTAYGSNYDVVLNVNEGGWYWSSTLNYEGSSCARGLYFQPSPPVTDVDDHERCDGHNIRPVYVGKGQNGNNNGSIKGQGTIDDPYLIGNKEQLKWFADQLLESYSISGRLTADIVFNENVLDENGNLNGDGSNFEQWPCREIHGRFYGGGHTISGLYINNDEEYQALFRGCTYVDSLGIIDSYIKGRRHVAGFAAWLGSMGGDGYMSDCYFEGVVIASQDKAGGLVAHMGHGYDGGTPNKIINCYNKGKVSGYNHVGGICGSAYSLTSTNKDDISNCYNVGVVSASSTDCGAICGYADDAVGSMISSGASHCYYLEGTCKKLGQGYMGTAKSLESFKDGSVCALLNNNGGKFKQRIGIDTYPILFGKLIEKYLTDNVEYENMNENTYDFINYTRNFNNTSWQALYIPFSMSYNDWKDEFDVAYINGIRQLDTDDDGAIDKTIMDVVKIKSGITAPNTPYLIKSKTTGEKTISVSNATLHKSEEKSEDCSTTIVKYTFTGTYSTIPASTLIANNYYTMSEGSLCMPNGTSDLLPYRWYMKAESRNSSYNISNSAKIITINVVGEEEEGMTTDIHQVGFNAESSSVIYDLNGRKVMEKALKPGLYIRNGKKVVVK